MSKEKQVEEIKTILNDYIKEHNIMASVVILERYAEALYNAGYRKQSDIVKCKNCDNCTILGHCKILTSKNGAPITLNPDDFCRWGIKKE